MTVSQTSPETSRTAVRQPAPAKDGDRRDGSSFADILASLGMREELPGNQINAVTGVGDAAEAFCARPIVGPVAQPAPKTDAQVPHPDSPAMATIASAESAGLPERSISENCGTEEVFPRLSHGPSVAERTNAGPAFRALSASNRGQPGTGAGVGSSSNPTTDKTQRLPKTLYEPSRPALPGSRLSTAREIVSIAVGADEIVVTLRGIELSSAEHEKLVEMVRDLEAESPTAERAVRIKSLSGSN